VVQHDDSGLHGETAVEGGLPGAARRWAAVAAWRAGQAAAFIGAGGRSPWASSCQPACS